VAVEPLGWRGLGVIGKRRWLIGQEGCGVGGMGRGVSERREVVTEAGGQGEGRWLEGEWRRGRRLLGGLGRGCD